MCVCCTSRKNFSQKNKFSFFLLCDIISVGSTGGIMINIENSFSFHNGDIIVIGCSAGPDSMALVDMLLKIREKYGLSLIIAHVNHNVRKESYEEADYVKNIVKVIMLFLKQ